MLPQQKLWFLNSFQYTWFTIAPEHAIISSDPDDATHFANVVHITRGWKSPPAIEPLCHQFNTADYRCRRLWTPVMDDANLCTPCRKRLQSIDATFLKHGPEVLFAPGGLIHRGGFADQPQSVATIISEYVEQENRRHQESQEQFLARLAENGVLLPPVPTPAIAAPNPCVSINDDDAAFRAWRDAHRADGYIINREEGGYIAHRADCPHMKDANLSSGGSWTEGNKTKIVTTDLSACSEQLHAPVRLCNHFH